MDKPAFPTDVSNGATGGLTMRDYFAAKAMAGLVARHGMLDLYGYFEYATEAYRIADAMLKAREN